ncbi:AQP protein, partial [Acromyrmex charruanus]
MQFQRQRMRCDGSFELSKSELYSSMSSEGVKSYFQRVNVSGIWKLQENTMTMLAAEIIGTAMLLYIGCMGSVGSMGSAPPALQTALAFGLSVNFIIMVLHISGAHFNPAITIGAVILGLKSWITLVELFNNGKSNSTESLCVTVVYPGLSSVQGLLIEIFCTCFLICAACATWDPRCSHLTDSIALKFGFSVTLLSFTAGPYTRFGMNPLRSFAPALWNSNWKDHWIYWVGPILGALLGTFSYQLLFTETQKGDASIDRFRHDDTDYCDPEWDQVSLRPETIGHKELRIM